MPKRSIATLLALCTVLATAMWASSDRTRPAQAAPETVGVPGAPLPEAEDFAVRHFGEAWDMDDFSDISQYLNGAGRDVILANPQVSDGLFSATSIGDRYAKLAYFFPLFPGFPGFMQIGGNLGSLHPIDTSAYQCFYIAMRVQSPDNPPEGPDSLRVLWYADQSLQPQGMAPNGGTEQVRLYPETLSGSPLVHNWKLFKVDLTNPPNGYLGGLEWTEAPTWMGLMINPTLYANIPFEVDWMRLTTCANSGQYQAAITWNPDPDVEAIWVRPVGTTRNIQVAPGVDGSSGSHSLDTKGLVPGTYQVGVGTITSCCSQWSTGVLEINHAPVVEFTRPTGYSGHDYATAGGNAWNIDPSDVDQIDCSTFQFENGLLKLDTLYPAALPSSCKGPQLGEADSRMFMNEPVPPVDANQYRYLSFRMKMDGDLSIPADGMIGRWIWTPLNNCTQVSADIPYDVGWHTYVIDLYDPFNGTPVLAVPSGCSILPWWQTSNLNTIRFDPNENWTGNLVPAQIFHQEFDWIRLTRVDQVTRGEPFPVQFLLNKPLDEIESINFYYTSNLGDPTQNVAVEDTPSPGAPPGGSDFAYLPISLRDANPGSLVFRWDTSGVSPGEYFVCAQPWDGFNQTTYCSKAPVKVVLP